MKIADALVAAFVFLVLSCTMPGAFALDVQKLAVLHDSAGNAAGVAGPFVGVLGGRLVVAGGTDAEHFHDTIRILEADKNGSFRWNETVSRLPAPKANGASLTVGDAVYMIGGSTPEGPSDECLKLVWNVETGRPETVPLPRLPEALAFSAAAVHDNVMYLAGGFTDEKSGAVSNRFFRLDLKRSGSDGFSWQSLPSWDGPARALAACAIQNDGDSKAFYLFGGRGLDESGKPIELDDAWRYRFDTGSWAPVENVDGTPFRFTAAPAVASGTFHVLFFGHFGHDDGFSDEIHAFNVVTKKLFLLGRTPEPLPSATPAVPWRGGYVLAGGENAPGSRASEIVHLELPKNRNRLGWLNIAVIVSYFALMLWMGVFFSRRQKNTEDYFRGGRRIPWWIIGISIYGTSMSSISYMAVPAKSFVSNWSYLLISGAALWAAPAVMFILIPRLRIYDLTSAYEYLEKRFSLSLRLLGSIVFMLFQVARMAVMLFLPAIALSVVTNIDICLCIVAIGVVSLVYTLYGGIEAVIWTDVVQVVILLGGILIAFATVYWHLDGGMLECARLAVSERKISLGASTFNLREPTFWTLLIASFFLYIIPFSSDQAIVQRYFMSRTNREAAGGLWVNAWIALPSAVVFFAFGTALYYFYRQNPTELSVTLGTNDSLLPWFVITQMPPGVSGLVIVAIFAAAMSSLSASVNAISAAFTVDFYQRLISRTGEPSLWCAKAATLIGGLCGIGFALCMVSWDVFSFWDEYNRLMGLISSGLAGLFFLGVLSKRANAPGALIGLLSGIGVQIVLMTQKTVHLLLYAGTGFCVCIAVGYAASLFFPAPMHILPVKHDPVDGPL